MLLSNLELFCEVARYKNITRAAHEAHITQPALSRAISRLEDSLGYKLLDRHTNGVTLNRCGEIVLEAYQRIKVILSEMENELDEYTGGKSREVRIATTFPSFRVEWINDCIKAYRKTHPKVLFSQMEISYDNVAAALKNREIDFALTDHILSDDTIVWHELYRERLALLMSRDSPLAGESSVSLCAVKDQPFVSYVSRYPYSPETDNTLSICKMAGFTPKVVFRGDLEDSVQNEVAAGRGMLLTSERSCIKLTEDASNPLYNKLAYCTIAEDFGCRVYGLASMRRHPVNIAVSDLYDSFINADFFM